MECSTETRKRLKEAEDDFTEAMQIWRRLVSTESHSNFDLKREIAPSIISTMIKDRNAIGRVLGTTGVFLCHSVDDKTAVRDLYQRLQDDGFHPWLDEKEMLPGQDWEHETIQALHKSHAVIVCMSQNSVTKRGFVQKEIKQALDVALEQPFGDIFLIPLRLEPCEIPDQLSKWQYVDYFEENGYAKLRRALDTALKQRRQFSSNAAVGLITEPSRVQKPGPSGTAKPLPGTAAFALTSLACLLVGASCLFFMIWQPERLVMAGLAERRHYVVLFFLGFSVAALLFAVLQTYARYHRCQLRSTLSLGAPIVAFFLTVGLGFVLIPEPSFRLTVYLHAPGSAQGPNLKNSGEVVLSLDGKPQRIPINDLGEAIFPTVPTSFRGQEVPISLISDKFESIQPTITLNGGSAYFDVHEKPCPPAIQTSSGSGSPNVQCVKGDVTMTIDQSSGTTGPQQSSDKKGQSRSNNHGRVDAAPLKSEPAKQSGKQTSTGPSSPNVQGIQGKLDIAIGQSSKTAQLKNEEPFVPKDTVPPQAPAESYSAADGNPHVKVWVNTPTHVYHCPAKGRYHKTKSGEFMLQAEAQKRGNRPAKGNVCK